MFIIGIRKMLGLLYDTPGDSGLGDFVDDEADVDDNKEGKEDDDEKVVPDEQKPQDKDEDEEDEDEEEDDEEEKDNEEEESEEEVDETDTIHVGDIKKVYPDFFKKFPEVKAALFRDQEYSQFFGSPKDASVAVERANALGEIEKELLVGGDPTHLLSTVKKENPESYTKVIFSILPYLQENDKDTYMEVAAVPIKQLLRSIFRKEGKDSNLGKAAQYVHQYFFDNLNFDDKVKAEDKLESKKSSKEVEYEERLKKINERETNNFSSAVNSSYVTRMTKEFRTGIENDDRLSEWAKTKLIEDGLVSIRKELEADPRYQRQLNTLWAQAKAAGYSNDFKSKIVFAALARAKSLVPAVRSKLIAEATGKSKKNKIKDKGEKSDKNVTQFSKDRSTTKERSTKEQGSKKTLTDLDILRGTA